MSSPASRASGRLSAVFGVLLIAATLLAYRPAWHGGWLWDDAGHITRPDLRSAAGLASIWTTPGATQQYYPVVHTAFWIQHLVWGDATTGYHLVNITLHAATAVLLALVLLRLGVPGPWFAAGIFALHPVHVESVAWISELKNVLSGTFAAGAALAFVRFDETRSRRAYATAAMLFVLALLTKTVAAMLAPVLLVVAWWRRGRLRWREDVRPLLPLVVLGAGAGLGTAWFERTIIGARGGEFSLALVERGLLAARACWFYLATLLWPSNLTFVYPRWTIDRADWRLWMSAAALVAAVASAWLWRRRSRAPIAAIAAFLVLLFPALGFVDVYPFRFSYVADHFQYLASIAVIVPVAAGLATVGEPWLGRAKAPLGAVLLMTLAALTWVQAAEYADAETLYRATLARNPSAWMAHNNLAVVLLEREPDAGRIREAALHAEAALGLKPDYQEARYNLGTALERLGQYEAAALHYTRVLEAEPDLVTVHYRLGIVLQALGRNDAALETLGRAVAIAPDSAEVRQELGRALAQAGRPAEAVEQFREVLRLRPDAPEARRNLGVALRDAGFDREERGRLDDAIVLYRQAAEVDPAAAVAWRSLGRVHHRLGRLEEAAAAYRQSLAVDPRVADVHNDLGAVLAGLGRLAEAEVHFAEAVRLEPRHEGAASNLARLRSLRRDRQQ